jgi:hypothetical protein
MAREGLITENGLTGVAEPASSRMWKISGRPNRIFALRPGFLEAAVTGQPLTVDDAFTYQDTFNLAFQPHYPRRARIGKSRVSQ